MRYTFSWAFSWSRRRSTPAPETYTDLQIEIVYMHFLLTHQIDLCQNKKGERIGDELTILTTTATKNEKLWTKSRKWKKHK